MMNWSTLVTPVPRYQERPPCGWVAAGASAVAFLAGAFPDLPRGFQPMLRVEGAGHRWVPAGRDTDSLLLSLNSWLLERLQDTGAPAPALKEEVGLNLH